MRIFFGTCEIAGWHLNLYKGCLELGLDCVYGCGFSSMPSYSGLSDLQQQPWVIRVFQELELKAAQTPRTNLARKIYHRLIDRLWRLVVLYYVIRSFDAVVYGFGSSIFCRHEMILMRIFGIRTLHVFHGSDSRHPAIDGSYFSGERRAKPHIAIKWCDTMQRKMNLIEKLADDIAMSPTTAHFLSKPFINWHKALGMPFKGVRYDKRFGAGEAIVIVHCPSLMAAKGSQEIISVVEALKSKGYNIDFRLIHGRPHSEVIEALKIADIAVDQLYSDLIFSGFGAEAAFYGVVPVTCGYADLWKTQWKVPGMPTGAYFKPEELESRLEYLINNPEHRKLLANECQNFVINNWEVKRLARNLVSILAGKSHNDWYCDPCEIVYLHGVGVSEKKAKEGIQLFLSAGGEDSLCLDDNPELKRAFCDFA